MNFKISHFFSRQIFNLQHHGHPIVMGVCVLYMYIPPNPYDGKFSSRENCQFLKFRMKEVSVLRENKTAFIE